MSDTAAVSLIIGAVTIAALVAGAVDQVRWHRRRRRQAMQVRRRLDRFGAGR